MNNRAFEQKQKNNIIANALGLDEDDDVTAMEMDLMNNGDFGASDKK